MAGGEHEDSEMRRAMSSLSLSGDARDAEQREAEEGDAGAPEDGPGGRAGAVRRDRESHGHPEGHVVRTVSARVRPRSFTESEPGSVRSAFDDGVPCTSGDAGDRGLLFEKFVVVGIGDETDSASEDGCGMYEPEIVTSWPFRSEDAPGDGGGGGDYGDIAVRMPEFGHFAFAPDFVEVWKNGKGRAGAAAAVGADARGDTPFVFLLRVPGTSVALWVRHPTTASPFRGCSREWRRPRSKPPD